MWIRSISRRTPEIDNKISIVIHSCPSPTLIHWRIQQYRFSSVFKSLTYFQLSFAVLDIYLMNEWIELNHFRCNEHDGRNISMKLIKNEGRVLDFFRYLYSSFSFSRICHLNSICKKETSLEYRFIEYDYSLGLKMMSESEKYISKIMQPLLTGFCKILWICACCKWI